MQLQDYKVVKFGSSHIQYTIPTEWLVDSVKNLSIKLVVSYVGICDPFYTQSGGIPMIRTTNVKEGYLDLKNLKYVTREFHEKNRKSQLQENDLIIARHGENGTACLVPKMGEANALSVVIIRPTPELWLPKFFEYMFNSSLVRKQISKNTAGGVQTVVNTTEVGKVLICLPSKKEQQKIAAILSNVDNLIKKTDQVIIQTQRLKKGLMQKLLTKGIRHTKFKNQDLDLGRKITIPESWHISRIGDTISDIQTGFASGERDTDGITQLRMNNISDHGTFDFSKLLKVPIPSDIRKYDIKKDDILFNNTNSLDLIGKTVISDSDLAYTFSNHISRIRTKPSVILPYYLYLLLLSFRKQNIYRSICNTHVGQSGIGKSELLKLLIYYPSTISEQQEIVNILKNISSIIQKLQDKKKCEEYLKKGLMQQLLTGKIRVKV